jgi:hypothetical protein
MSTQQWRKTLIFMSLFLAMAWSMMGFTPNQSMADQYELDYFPAPTQQEIEARLQIVNQRRAELAVKNGLKGL